MSIVNILDKIKRILSLPFSKGNDNTNTEIDQYEIFIEYYDTMHDQIIEYVNEVSYSDDTLYNIRRFGDKKKIHDIIEIHFSIMMTDERISNILYSAGLNIFTFRQLNILDVYAILSSIAHEIRRRN